MVILTLNIVHKYWLCLPSKNSKSVEKNYTTTRSAGKSNFVVFDQIWWCSQTPAICNTNQTIPRATNYHYLIEQYMRIYIYYTYINICEIYFDLFSSVGWLGELHYTQIKASQDLPVISCLPLYLCALPVLHLMVLLLFNQSQSHNLNKANISRSPGYYLLFKSLRVIQQVSKPNKWYQYQYYQVMNIILSRSFSNWCYQWQ